MLSCGDVADRFLARYAFGRANQGDRKFLSESGTCRGGVESESRARISQADADADYCAWEFAVMSDLASPSLRCSVD
jgi:hypothetical protein